MKSSIILPDLIFELKKYRVGNAQQLLSQGGELIVNAVEKVKITSRSDADSLVLSNGEKIIITEKTRMALPKGVDGVLRLQKNGEHTWLAHKKLDHAAKDLKKLGIKGYAVEIASKWAGVFEYRSQGYDEKGEPDETRPGLRPPQLGALFAIASHWSLNSQSGTIIMPTGTGKTETMLSVLASQGKSPIVVGVPSKALRKQTARKFLTFGLLRKLKMIPLDSKNPVVGMLLKQPKDKKDLEIFENCNVIVSVVAGLTGGKARQLASEMAEKVEVLIVDEAHHIAASTWSEFKDAFSKKLVLQFTATPFRADGKIVDGEILFNYSLKRAQQDKYFKPIKFLPVHEILDNEGDDAIARKACDCLRSDIVAGCNHLIMARYNRIERAQEVLELYKKYGSEFAPQLLHSELADNSSRIEKLLKGTSRIAVCVNMLGEGFDLPSLKIAAIHDPQKSLGPLLQFAGRFTRTSGEKLGDATVIGNIANDNVSSALERLYREDSDWNTVLSELSSEAARGHAKLIEFLKNSELLSDDSSDFSTISQQLLHPTLSTLTFACDKFLPKKFHEAIPKGVEVVRVWLNEKTKTLFFVTRSKGRIKWTRSKEIADLQWDLFVLHQDAARNLLYLASSDKSSNHEQLAAVVGAVKQLSGELIFRCLGGIGRLIFTNLGVSKHGRRNLSYAMYTGADVRQALTLSEKAGSRKANLSGMGWENGRQTTIGCSYKGRVWAKDAATIPEFIEWAEAVGAKLLDDSINTANIIDNVLIPDELTSLPDKTVLGMEWPVELLRHAEERVVILNGSLEVPFYLCDVQFKVLDPTTNRILFLIIGPQGEAIGEYAMTINPATGFEITLLTPTIIKIKIAAKEFELKDFFAKYPPLVRFVDLNELDGNLLLRPQNPYELKLPTDFLEAWSWTGVDIKKESLWKDGKGRKDSIQWAVAQRLISEEFDVVFDDDGPNEAADIIGIKEESSFIRLTLIHCKFSSGKDVGERLSDIVVVASQATRSARWAGKFRDLCRHMSYRNANRKSEGGRNFFLEGSVAEINRLSKASKFKEVKPEIQIAQPGVSAAAISPDQEMVLAAAATYIKQTIGIDIVIGCSA
jgi:superfamily II DNA or RNA helicase